MSNFPFRERRRYVRAGFSVDVLCALPDNEKWLDIYTATSMNISRRGMCVSTSDIIRPGLQIYLQFYLSNYTNHFRIYTKVIWNRFDPVMRGWGVYFTDIGEKFEEMIEHFVLKHYDFKSASNF